MPTSTYPDDATFNVNNFSTLNTVEYNNTAAEIDFNIGVTVAHRGEVLVIVDGALQDQTSYTLSNGNYTTTFFDAPGAANLTLKAITVPDRFTKITSFPTILEVDYANTFVTEVNSNDYIIDGVITTWAVPETANPSTKNELLVTASGATMTDSGYTYPSATLGNQGIDLPIALDGSDTTLAVRVFNSDSSTELCRRNDMSDRSPDKGFTVDKRIDVSKYKSIAGYEKRRLISRRPERTWNFTYGKVSGIEKQAIETFWDNRFNDYEAFFFDLSHIEEVGTVTVRFEGPLQVRHIATLGDDVSQSIYSINIVFQEVYD